MNFWVAAFTRFSVYTDNGMRDYERNGKPGERGLVIGKTQGNMFRVLLPNGHIEIWEPTDMHGHCVFLEVNE